MDTTGTDDDEETLCGILVVDYGGGFVAALNDSFFRGGGLRDLVLEEVRCYKRVVAADAPVF